MTVRFSPAEMKTLLPPEPYRELLESIMSQVCRESGFGPTAIRGYGREPDLIRARQLVMWKARVEGIPVMTIGAFLHRDHTTVCHAHSAVERRSGDATPVIFKSSRNAA